MPDSPSPSPQLASVEQSAEEQSAEEQSAEEQSAVEQSAEEQSAVEQSAEEQSAEEQSAEEQSAEEQSAVGSGQLSKVQLSSVGRRQGTPPVPHAALGSQFWVGSGHVFSETTEAQSPQFVSRHKHCDTSLPGQSPPPTVQRRMGVPQSGVAPLARHTIDSPGLSIG
jgi:hypothetical protein